MKERSLVKETGKFIAYYRVSTDKQGQSGLGLEAQRNSVIEFVSRERGVLHREYTEVESGAQKRRPELASALAECRRSKATLVIAKLDRLARNVYVISGLIESGVEFVAVDNPHANKLMLHLLAAFAEHEREQIAARTKSALLAAKARGVRLGASGACRASANKAKASAFADKIAPEIMSLTQRGLKSANSIAAALNAGGIPAYSGGRWHAGTVIRVLSRLEDMQNVKPLVQQNV